MIVVDTNVIAYLVIRGQQTATAERILQADPNWIAPYLWRSEFRNILVNYMRQEIITLDEARSYMGSAAKVINDAEYAIPSADVLDLALQSNLSAYDCEFVALAMRQQLPLISADKKIVRAFPQIAVSMDRFASEPPERRIS